MLGKREVEKMSTRRMERCVEEKSKFQQSRVASCMFDVEPCFSVRKLYGIETNLSDVYLEPWLTAS